MAQTIRNPVEWGAEQAAAAAQHVAEMGGALRGAGAELPAVRKLEMSDIGAVLRLGLADFKRVRSDVLFLCLLYPVVGACLVYAALNNALLPLIFPALSGFALVGPLAGVGLCEMSRRMEAGGKASWGDAFGVLKAPSFGAIALLGMILVAIFVVWMMTAMGISTITMGAAAPDSMSDFIGSVTGTEGGWAMIVIGLAVGFLFALVVLAISVVSFPLLLDRKVGLPVAIVTSIRVATTNPRVIGAWGLTVAGLLALGSLPALLGLMVVLPVLGHATWHLYRRAVEPA